ncbi:MAG: hypothetical protein FD154_2499 [Elusimicrobia bacterium]|nr:MAG: hypothetical protein FD154_2499 [Elusimicrobiota bacterium]
MYLRQRHGGAGQRAVGAGYQPARGLELSAVNFRDHQRHAGREAEAGRVVYAPDPGRGQARGEFFGNFLVGDEENDIGFFKGLERGGATGVAPAPERDFCGLPAGIERVEFPDGEAPAFQQAEQLPPHHARSPYHGDVEFFHGS